MIEYLDIVDEHDVIIGRDTRDHIHRGNHLHRSAHILLTNSQGKVFVQLRSMSKDNGAGLWDTSAAGHVDSGESYLDCALRELTEELGVTLQAHQLTPLVKLTPHDWNGFEFSQVYRAVSDQPLTLQREEIDDGVWKTPDELNVWCREHPHQFTDVFLRIWALAQPC